MIRDTSATDIPLETRPQRLPVRWLVAAAIVAALAWLGAHFIGGAEKSVALERLRIAEVTRARFVSDINAQGRVVAARSPTLYAPALGTATLAVQAGDSVQQGQVIATLDSPELTNDLARSEADLQGLEATRSREQLEVETQRLQNQQAVDLAKVNVDAAERELKRSQDARDQGLLPVMEVDRRGDELISARVRYRHAAAEEALQRKSLDLQLKSRQLEIDKQQLVVDNAQRRVDELSIRSPVDGVVGNVLVEQRAAVAANAPLLTVVDLTALEVEIQVPESYADQLGIDMPAVIRVGQNQYQGKLAAVSPEVKDNQVTGRVRFDGDAPADLRQNQRVTVSVLLDARDGVLQLPRGSFVDNGGGHIAYVVRDGVAERTPIRLGATSIDRVEIVEGLAPGARLVVSGDQDFNDAATVRIRE